MKKIFTLAVAACTVFAASAQQLMRMNPMQPKVATMTEAQKMNFSLKGEARKATAVLADATDTLYYGRPNYAFNVGLSPDMGMYYPMIVASGVDSLVFLKDNYCMHTSAQYDWAVNGTQMGIMGDTLLYALPGDLSADGICYLPQLIDENNGSYMYGESESAQYLLNAPSSFLPLTKCAIYTSSVVDANAWDMYSMYWSQSAGTFFMGTGMAPAIGGVATPVDTLFTYMGTPNSFSEVDTVSLYVWSTQADPLPANGAGLKLTIGNQKSGAVSYTAHTSDIIGWEKATNGSYYGMLNFPVNGRFAGEYMCILNGFQQTGNKIAAMTDYYSWNYFSGDIDPVYMQVNGRGYSFGNNIGLFVNSKYVSDFTGLNDVEAASTKIEKVLENGKLFIIKNGVKYNANGMIVK